MKGFPILAVGAALTGLLATRPAEALTITLEAAAPVTVGQPQTFKVASVTDGTGTLSFRWTFGDDSPVVEGPARQVTHSYLAVGHYPVIVLATDDAGRTSATAIQTVYVPATARPPSNSSSIVFDPDRRQVWNVNPDSNSVSIIDAVGLKRVREIPVGKEPHFLALAPDGTVWVANQMSDEIVVLDRASGDIKARIALPYASQPRSVVFGPGPSPMAYVSLFATGQLFEIDPATRGITRRLALGPTPAGVSVAADGRIFVTRFLSPVDHGEVWVVSPQTFTVSNTISLAFDKGPDTQSSGRGVPNYVGAILISPDGTQAWVTAKKDNTARGIQRDGQPMTFDNFVRPAVCTIDLATEQEVIAKRQDVDNRATPVSVAFSALSDYAFVLIQPSNWIGIMDAFSAEQVSGIRDVGNAPDGLLMTPDGKLFVHGYLSREVIVYDVRSSLSSEDHAAPEPMAHIPTIDVEPLSAQILMGKRMFFNAADTRMGHAGYMACVSCHFGGFSDGRVWDFTDRGEGLRNTKSLLGVRGTAEGRVHWSANFDEIQDFERDIRHDFGGSGFMSDAEYDARSVAVGDAAGTKRYDPFSKSAAGVSVELDALAAFLKSLDKVPRSPYRNPDGSFTAAALEGRKVFERAGCVPCHSGPDLTDSPAGIVHDIQSMLSTSGSRLFGKLTGIDTPSLKGVWQSAPYYHDGRASTLKELFTKYNQQDQMGVTSNLTPTELDQMVEYLMELDDEPVTTPAAPTPTPSTTTKPASGKGLCSIEPGAPSLLSAALGSALAMAALAICLMRTRKRGRRRT